MIDQVFIHIFSGKGGSGSISGRREKFVARGGPDGGDGGTGGSVYMLADQNVNTLQAFRYKRSFAAGNGGNGAGANKHGRNGDDIEISVPVGTQVWTLDDPPRLLADLSEHDQRVLLASGGRGGRGNARFKSSTNQFPKLAEAGEEGEQFDLRLELKLLADVGIIGVPNAGKSSLLSVVSAARPKVADYPFTTLEPVLGVVERHDKSFVMVDIPGLIEGAHKGVGLGHEFLRHVERTRVLVHLLDGLALDPLDDFRKVNEELRLYSEALTRKPRIVAINKIDIPEVRELASEMKAALSSETDAPVFLVSAATGEGVDALLDRALQVLEAERQRVEAVPRSEREAGELPVLRPRPRREPVTVSVDSDGAYVVHSPMASRIAAMIDASDWEASLQFYRYMRDIGVVKALEEAGVAPGDTVRIGKVELEWE